MNLQLEEAIDKAGREAVFAEARAQGWHSEAPPDWVWWEIVAKVKARRAQSVR